jgi:hypothetical protein
MFIQLNGLLQAFFLFLMLGVKTMKNKIKNHSSATLISAQFCCDIIKIS